VDLREIGWGGMDWIHLAQDGDQWRSLVNTAMNLRVPQNVENFLSGWRLVASREGFSSMELVGFSL
jgi:hypothetical protein